MSGLRFARPAGRDRDRGENTTGVLSSARRGADAAVFDELRRSEYARLDAGGHVYLDYTGAGLYAESQLAEHVALLRDRVFGNPHSLNPTSAAMTELVERARRRARLLPRLARRVRGGLHSERDRRAAPGRRSLPVPGR